MTALVMQHTFFTRLAKRPVARVALGDIIFATDRGHERWIDRRRFVAHRGARPDPQRSEEHTSELQSLMRISYAVFCLIKQSRAPITYCSHNTIILNYI